MGYMIGMPCLKLNNVGRKSASCGGFKSVAEEALEERKGRDPDINRDLTPDNIYTGFRTAAELMEYSDQHVADMSEQLQAEGKRKIRQDAVVMIATIIKPPAAFMATLTKDDQVRFLQDAGEKLDELVGKNNVKSKVIHFDEQGGHLHAFWEPMTGDGRLCAKEAMNLKFFNRLNKEMPAFLRSRGWDIDDCNAYDEAKEALKTEEEKYQERRKSGRSSVAYKAQAEAEKNRLCEEIDDLQTQAEELRKQVEVKTTDLETAESARKKAEEEAKDAEKRKKKAEDRLEELVEPIRTLEEYNSTADKAEDLVVALEASEKAVEGLKRLSGLVPFYNRRKASKEIQEVSEGLSRLFKIAKDLVRRLFGFEDLTEMPQKKRRSPSLEDRIRSAARKSNLTRDERSREAEGRDDRS